MKEVIPGMRMNSSGGANTVLIDLITVLTFLVCPNFRHDKSLHMCS